MSRVHLVGIGGTGLSAIARVLLERGVSVSGSDQHMNALTTRLSAGGAAIAEGHDAANVHGAGQVIVSSAISPDNPEVLEARRLGIPVLKRAEFMQHLLAGKQVVAVAGTHGKTTTTAMIAFILDQAGLDPSFIAGGVVPGLATNARAGRGAHFVIEADEYDHMFLGIHPWMAVITNIEWDHVDCYPCMDDVCRAFAEFAHHVDPEGCVLACQDDPTAVRVMRDALDSADRERRPVLETYGLTAGADWQAESLTVNDLGGMRFSVARRGDRLGWFDTSIPGSHNVSNALATIAVAGRLGIAPPATAAALRAFTGVERRFEIKGTAAGVTVVDDYAHHPTEIRATLQGARQRYPGRRIWAVFQPHTYSRIKALFADFVDCFQDADHLVVTDVYAARELDDGSNIGAALARETRLPPATHCGTLDAATEFLANRTSQGDVVITLGAGDGYEIGERLLVRLAAGSMHHGDRHGT